MRGKEYMLIDLPVLIKDPGLIMTRREARKFADLIVIQDTEFSEDTRCLTYKEGSSVTGASKLSGVPAEQITKQRILFNILGRKKCEENFALGKPKYTLSVVEERLNEYFNCTMSVNVIIVDASESISRRHLVFARNAFEEYLDAHWNIKPHCSIITRKTHLVESMESLMYDFDSVSEGSVLLYEHNNLKLIDLKNQ